MAVFTCFVHNNTGAFVRAVIASQFGETHVNLAPGSLGTVFLRDGIKTLSSFNLSTGDLIALVPIFVAGPEVFEVQQGGIAVPAPVPGAPPTLPPPPPGAGVA